MLEHPSDQNDSTELDAENEQLVDRVFLVRDLCAALLPHIMNRNGDRVGSLNDRERTYLERFTTGDPLHFLLKLDDCINVDNVIGAEGALGRFSSIPKYVRLTSANGILPATNGETTAEELKAAMAAIESRIADIRTVVTAVLWDCQSPRSRRAFAFTSIRVLRNMTDPAEFFAKLDWHFGGRAPLGAEEKTRIAYETLVERAAKRAEKSSAFDDKKAKGRKRRFDKNDPSLYEDIPVDERGRFMRQWDREEAKPRFTMEEQYRHFDRYDQAKRALLERTLFRRSAMRLAATLVMRAYKRDGQWAFGQITSPYSAGMPADLDALLEDCNLDGIDESLRMELTEDRRSQRNNEDETSIDEFIDFNLKPSELSMQIKANVHRFLLAFSRVEGLVDRVKFRKKPGDPEAKPLASEEIMKRIEDLWMAVSQSEHPHVALRRSMNVFCQEMREKGCYFPGKNTADVIAKNLRRAQGPRKKVFDLLMRMKPSPELIEYLTARDDSDDTSENLKALKTQRTALLDPYVRNAYFQAAMKARRSQYSPELCVQIGVLGLMRSVDVFDYRLGGRFWEYGGRHANAAITRSAPDDANMIAIPAHNSHLLHQVRTAKRFAAAMYGDTSTEKIAEIAGVSIEDVQEARRLTAINMTASLDAPLYETEEGDSMTLLDTTEACDTQTPDDILAPGFRKRALLDVMDKAGLPERERVILTQRFSLLGDGDLQTLEEVGELHNLTRERIRQLEARALKKLRHYMATHSLSMDDF